MSKAIERVLNVVVTSAIVAACGGNLASTPDAGGATDDDDGGAASACTISGSNYDLSCESASDCVAYAGGFPVMFGNYCQASSSCLCGGDAINKSSVGQYVSDVSGTPLAKNPGMCNCTGDVGPCCVAGQCAVGGACVGPPPDRDASVGEPPDASQPPPNATVYCNAEDGAADAADGVGRWCVSPQLCQMFNGEWECCLQVGEETLCTPPADQ
jgi:hypothetical protein